MNDNYEEEDVDVERESKICMLPNGGEKPRPESDIGYLGNIRSEEHSISVHTKHKHCEIEPINSAVSESSKNRDYQNRNNSNRDASYNLPLSKNLTANDCGEKYFNSQNVANAAADADYDDSCSYSDDGDAVADVAVDRCGDLGDDKVNNKDLLAPVEGDNTSAV